MIKLSYPEFWQRKGLLAYLLLPLGLIYLLLGKLRQFCVRSQVLPGKVVCIGNSTVGGTGKTQLVIWLAKQLQSRNIKLVIISKGYGGSYKDPTIVTSDMPASIVGDEALVLCEHGITIISKKVTSCFHLLKELEPEVIIVDDGMQNPSFIKDCIIMTLDSARGIGNGFLLPAGPMRESFSSALARADAVVAIGHSNLAPPAFFASITPAQAFDKNKKYYAFAGIGNPKRFFETLKASGLTLITTKAFPDHHAYSSEDIATLQEEARQLGAFLITTKKDYVKCKRDDILCFDVSLSVQEGEKLMNLIYAKLYQFNKS